MGLTDDEVLGRESLNEFHLLWRAYGRCREMTTYLGNGGTMEVEVWISSG